MDRVEESGSKPCTVLYRGIQDIMLFSFSISPAPCLDRLGQGKHQKHRFPFMALVLTSLSRRNSHLCSCPFSPALSSPRPSQTYKYLLESLPSGVFICHVQFQCGECVKRAPSQGLTFENRSGLSPLSPEAPPTRPLHGHSKVLAQCRASSFVDSPINLEGLKDGLQAVRTDKFANAESSHQSPV